MITKKTLSVKAKIIVLLLQCAAVFIVLSTNNYPQKATIQLKVLSLNQEVLQLFWLNEKGVYSQEQSGVVLLKPGGHDYTLAIEPSTTITKLRIDPAVRKSVIEIESLTLDWDGRKVFTLSGKDLGETFSVVQEVALDWNQKHRRVRIISAGVDPIVELDMDQLTGSFRRARLFSYMLLALSLTLPFVFSLLYLTSDKYINVSHSTYPQLKRHWIYWGICCFFLGGLLAIVIPVSLPAKNPTLYFLAFSYCVGLLLLIPFFWFTTRKMQFTVPVESQRLTWLWFALPSFLVWSFYLLSFWPGSMSPDSMMQWKQVLNGHLRDWHPAFHTMNLWLLTRMKLSPATVAIAQIIALGSAMGWALSVLQRYGISKAILWITSLFFALCPVNGFMVITLWKDIAYSIVLLILAVYVFQIVMQKGVWLVRSKNWILLGCMLALVSLYRHNGILPAFATVVFLLCFYLRYWKAIALAAILAFILHTGIRGPLYNALDVRRGNPLTQVQQRLKSELYSLYKEKLQRGQSKKMSNKANVQSVSDGAGVGKMKGYHSGKIWDRIYSASILWRIKPIDFYYTRIDYVNLWYKVRNGGKRIKYMSSNRLGVKENSIIPAGKEYLFEIFNESRYNKYLFWLWRPAFYLYAFAGLVVLLSLRHRKKMYLILIPSLVNSLPIFLIVVHKSIFRYHYPVVVLCLVLFVPLLFLRDVQDEGEIYDCRE